jgi:hypothetical protein
MNTQYKFNIIKQESNQFIIELTDPQELKDVKMRNIIRYCNNQFDFDKAECGQFLKGVSFNIKTLEQSDNIELLETTKNYDLDFMFYLSGVRCTIKTKESADKNIVDNLTYRTGRDESDYTNPNFTKSDDIIHTARSLIYDRLDCYKNKYVISCINGLENDDYDLTMSSYSYAPNLNELLHKRIFLILNFCK